MFYGIGLNQPELLMKKKRIPPEQQKNRTKIAIAQVYEKIVQAKYCLYGKI